MGLTPIRHGPDDPALPALHALIHHCFAPMETRISPPSSVHRLTLDALQTEAKQNELWSLGTPPRACILLTSRADSLYIGKLSVAPEARRQGLAMQLLNHATSRAKSLGLPALELQSRVELTEVHATFIAFGFTETGRTAHRGFARPTSITFRRSIV